MNIQPGERVLDLACGTGANIPHLRKLVGDKGQVIGIDISPRMLERARLMIANNDWKNVEVIEVDAAHLPYADGFFNKVICSYALNIIPDYARTIAEVKRVLAPDGRFVSLEVRSGHSMPKWIAPICAVDLSHETLSTIKSVFSDVRIRTYWKGMIIISAATK